MRRNRHDTGSKVSSNSALTWRTGSTTGTSLINQALSGSLNLFNGPVHRESTWTTGIMVSANHIITDGNPPQVCWVSEARNNIEGQPSID